MNFFAHALTARWRSDDPRFLLGAMLPDLTAMLGLRLRGSSDPELSAGIDYHHATDAAFHACPQFVRMCAAGVAELTDAGVARGAARAVAHVGIELLLDGCLSHDREARAAYTDALRHAIEHDLSDRLVLSDADDRPRLHGGFARLSGAPVPEGYREPGFVLDRLQNMLSRRPRLALRPEDLSHARRFLAHTHVEVIDCAPEILAQVRGGIGR